MSTVRPHSQLRTSYIPLQVKYFRYHFHFFTALNGKQKEFSSGFGCKILPSEKRPISCTRRSVCSDHQDRRFIACRVKGIESPVHQLFEDLKIPNLDAKSIVIREVIETRCQNGEYDFHFCSGSSVASNSGCLGLVVLRRIPVGFLYLPLLFLKVPEARCYA